MICLLGPVGCGCSGVREDGHCGIYPKEGVTHNMDKGSCVFRNWRAPEIGIYTPKGARKINPLKAAKAAQRVAAKA